MSQLQNVELLFSKPATNEQLSISLRKRLEIDPSMKVFVVTKDRRGVWASSHTGSATIEEVSYAGDVLKERSFQP